jgi:hypothetical protein
MVEGLSLRRRPHQRSPLQIPFTMALVGMHLQLLQAALERRVQDRAKRPFHEQRFLVHRLPAFEGLGQIAVDQPVEPGAQRCEELQDVRPFVECLAQPAFETGEHRAHPLAPRLHFSVPVRPRVHSFFLLAIEKCGHSAPHRSVRLSLALHLDPRGNERAADKVCNCFPKRVGR